MGDLWKDRRDRHELWTVLDELDGLTAEMPMPDTVDQADALDRIRWLVNELGAHRDADPRGYSPGMLGEATRQLRDNVLANIRAYAADPAANASALDAAAINVDTVLDSMTSWPPLFPKGAAQAAGKTWSEYAAAAQRSLEHLDARVQELDEAADDVKAALATHDAGITTQKATLETEVADALAAKIDEIAQANDDAVSTARARADQLVADLTTQLEEIKKLAEETRNVAAAFAQRTQARDYGSNARKKAFAGWVWDLLGVAVAGTAIAILLWRFFFPVEGTPDAGDNGIALALTRLAISGAAVGLAVLCFRRGSENHRESRRSKRAEIRLRTAEPFLANLHPDVRAAVLEGMADRMYLLGQLDEDPEPSTKRLQEYLDQVLRRKELEDDEDT